MVEIGRSLHFWLAYTFLGLIVLHVNTAMEGREGQLAAFPQTSSNTHLAARAPFDRTAGNRSDRGNTECACGLALTPHFVALHGGGVNVLRAVQAACQVDVVRSHFASGRARRNVGGCRGSARFHRRSPRSAGDVPRAAKPRSASARQIIHKRWTWGKGSHHLPITPATRPLSRD